MKVILTPNCTLGYSNWVNLTILVSVCQLFWFSGWSLPTWWLPGRRGGWAHWWAGREEYRLQTCTGEGGEREIWVNLEQFLGPTFHVASVPDLHSAFCPLQQREASLFYAASDKEQGRRLGERFEKLQVHLIFRSSATWTWVTSFPGSSPAIITTPERSLGTRVATWVCLQVAHFWSSGK